MFTAVMTSTDGAAAWVSTATPVHGLVIAPDVAHVVDSGAVRSTYVLGIMDGEVDFGLPMGSVTVITPRPFVVRYDATGQANWVTTFDASPGGVDANALHLLGLITSQQNDPDLGVQLIEKAIGENPGAPAFHHNIAGIYRRMGRLDEAELQFRKAIELTMDDLQREGVLQA